MNKMSWDEMPSQQQMKAVGIALLLVCSVTSVIWMSKNTFVRVQDSRDQIHATITLKQDVSQLRTQYLEADSASLKADFEYADHLLIQNVPHLAQWAQELQRQGKQLNLNMQYRIVKTAQATTPANGLTVVPMEIQVLPDGTPNTYRAYLQFLRTLEQSRPRLDIQKVTVTGDGQQATRLTIGLAVWMKTVNSVEL